MSKTAKEIVVEHLKANGYDGLYDDECGCDVDDLGPCSGGIDNCIPGHLIPCNCGCDNHIGPKE